MRTATAALLLALLLGAAASAGAVVASPAGPPDAGGPAGTTLGQESPNATDPLTIRIQIREDGDAEVTIRQRFRTATPAQRDAFERIAEDFRFGRRDLAFPAFQAAVPSVDAATDREMVLADANLNIDEGEPVSSISRTFTWTNFAAVEGERLAVGDAFVGEDGLWLQTLETDVRLVVSAPEGYRVADAPQGPRVRDSRELIWEGYRTFDPEDLRVTFAPAEDSNLWSYLLLAVVGLVILAIGALLLRREGRPEPPGTPDPQARLASHLPWGGTDAGELASDAADGGARAPDQEPGAGVDPELLSDEERVELLLERNGGRMKQSNIVSETGWSNAKVSQLLSEMAEEERVDKLRIGRENLISLPDHDVTEEQT